MFFCFRNPAMKPLLLVLLLLFPAATLWAEDEPPPPPPPAQEGEEELEPEVTIRQQGSRTIHEYRVNGQLYMVKIVPKKGPPYYLMDLNGDGQMDTQEDDPTGVVVPQWVFLRW
ncbi:DUF2782 domain-containing protein [Thiolapillus sp.]|uniref:DUF2782 domain-containing protein n=3 Tax=Thiolapillus sp. TaxID=2017437 RepID=UPI0025E8B39E|nr:DUF2782 domain-containing protein [Thiolapillus sp.]